jgi:transglutaminase-like putative cysteine protease
MPPAETLRRGRGACRDSALLAAAILRHRGIATRLVSGYLSELHLPPEDRRAEAALHAWVEAYVPGAGWIGLDPTHGVLCDHCFLPAAVGISPADVAPISGNYFSPHPVPSRMFSSVTVEEIGEAGETAVEGNG